MGNSKQLPHRWLDTLFKQGMKSMETLGPSYEQDRAMLAINVIVMFNLTSGDFLAQKAFDKISEEDLKSPGNLAKQQQLLHRIIRAMLTS